MSLTPGQTAQATLVATDNDGKRFTAPLELPPGAPGAAGDLSGALSLQAGGTVEGPTLFKGNVTFEDVQVNFKGCPFSSDTFYWSGALGGLIIGEPTSRVQIGQRQDSAGTLQGLYVGLTDTPSINWAEWLFDRSGAVITPKSNTLFEIATPGSVPYLVQIFSVTGANGQGCGFPKPFSGNDVRVVIPTVFTAAGNLVVAGVSGAANASGFTLTRYIVATRDGAQAAWDSDTSPLLGFAIGPA
ncbi:hypothetical protein [Oecophyllibacter saccharovorans]|uniref:Uncharacterized protein n=1 Tax=Oecophyllibacter saccharovorans TaxID=2558360 RepID=A0A506UM32_9PROT|nr:hypothetical protein [Oecophyllibacter saccharovorans]TPW34388.1 hypothetical protein E3202_07845 [Oecophyllibacter saccharovorans]